MEHDESNANDVEDGKLCEKGCTLRTNDNDDAGPRMEFYLKASFKCAIWDQVVEHCFHFDYTYQNVDYTSIVELHLSQSHKSGDWWKSDNVKIYGIYWC
ncbi:unnamed protein product, partial [Mesorhabditis belari]|uniref:Uncharacterized protein n=1 Tax=Mesorhabditis belari TaxID=2138241 RepID=A0AAF3F9S9_9BILA